MTLFKIYFLCNFLWFCPYSKIPAYFIRTVAICPDKLKAFAKFIRKIHYYPYSINFPSISSKSTHFSSPVFNTTFTGPYPPHASLSV